MDRQHATENRGNAEGFLATERTEVTERHFIAPLSVPSVRFVAKKHLVHGSHARALLCGGYP